MTSSLVVIRDGKKFLWDGKLYDSGEEAQKIEAAYRNDKFEVYVAEVEGQFSVYTRRVVSQIPAVQ